MPCPRCGDRCTCACSGDPLPSNDWRHQVALQVRAHKARKRRGRDIDSPQLEFTDELPLPETSTLALRAARWRDAENVTSPESEISGGISCQVAPVEKESPLSYATNVEALPAEEVCGSNVHIEERPPLPPFPRVRERLRKVIEFPGTPSRAYELAEPVTDQLRIFEAFEELPPPPISHLTAIEIAPEEPGILQLDELEVPIRSAPLGMRVYAAAVDAAVMIAAIAVFAGSAGCFISSLPMSKPLLASGTIAFLLLLSAYYLLSLTMRRSTPGMQASGISVITFNGIAPSRLKLACRALATVLSMAALGMGFAWALIDDDQLCWHDRITHTYLTPKPE